MSIQEIVSILVNSGIEENEANIEVKMLIKHFCNYSVKDIIMGKKLDKNMLDIVKEKALLRSKTKLPIQYIIGEAYFMGNFYKVNKDVLIPRDETEIVVRHAIDLIDKNNYSNILDIGTGSGCIACAIAQNTNSYVVASDISSKAINVAKINSDRLNISNIEFWVSDIFSNLDGKQFDLIISNPPYIPTGTVLSDEVNYEPSLALFANGDSGTEFYKRIIFDSLNYMNRGGAIVFEIGINQSEIVKGYFKEAGFENISVINDLAGIPRVVSAFLIQ